MRSQGQSHTWQMVALILAAILLSPISLFASQYAYITNVLSNNVSVVDTGTKQVVTTIPVGAFPAGLAITPNGAFAYVPNYHDVTVSVIDTLSNLVVNTITVQANPQQVAITPNGALAYVTNNGSNSVSVIDLTVDTVVATVPVGVNPALVAITPNGAFAYVTNFGSNTVSVIATASNTVVATIPVGTQPQCLAITRDGLFVYVENRLSDTLSIISTDSNTVVATIVLPAGSQPNGMALTPNGAFLYLAEYASSVVTVIDTESNTIVGTIPVGASPCGVTASADGAFVYVAESGVDTVAIIDTSRNAVVGRIQVGDGPVVIALTPIVPPLPPLQFVPVTPCRLIDTRKTGGPIPGGTWRSFKVSQLGGCHIPSSALAYSLNVTVVPPAYLGFVSIWPTGVHRPIVSTLNSLDGRIKANAAIVPAGTLGAVNVYVSQTTDVVLDINGYFARAGASTLNYYALTPCRVADTRKNNFPQGLGSPQLYGQTARSFPVLNSPCIPSGVHPQAYSFNFTVVPIQQHKISYLSVWPTGLDQPLVSTLNDLTGTIVANAGIVPAGSDGAVSVYSTDDTQLLIDINGYFAPPGQGGLSLYPALPCRVLDTRKIGDGQPFNGTLTPAVDVVGSPCAVPGTALGYVFNATVVPVDVLGYLTLWPDGQPRPVVSTLNALDGAITSNMAIVPAGKDGKVDAYASGWTQLILDISSYFAP